jgi:hypothetical protein
VIRPKTRHSVDFDIFMLLIDPAQSPYAQDFPGYAPRLRSFYETLGVRSALWKVAEEQKLQVVEPSKPIEYILEVAEDRIVAYVNDVQWTYFFQGKATGFDYSRTPRQYPFTSILVAAPIQPSEVKEKRCLI